MKREYNQEVTDQIRELLVEQKNVVEKEMFNGLCFMVDDKMCICVTKEDLLCRIGQERVEKESELGSCRPMMMNGRVSKDFVYVDLIEIPDQKRLKHWISLCLDFNPIAKASKK
ncbi:TfoX/Sxy family protein [Pedobacter sp. GR22-6]|uniref:TfoX/Sxy family protein n=1 Tax=Pedobacter sp. GR22-6 TaxID=3127957 RepID=UPI00307E22C4